MEHQTFPQPLAPVEHISESEMEEGFARIDADLAASAIAEKATNGDFIVFERV